MTIEYIEESERKLIHSKYDKKIQNLKAGKHQKTIIYKYPIAAGSMYYGSVYTQPSDTPSGAGGAVGSGTGEA